MAKTPILRSFGAQTGPAHIALFGDSRILDSHTLSALRQDMNANGLAAWLQILGEGRFIFPGDLNFGVAGDKTSDMRARIGAVLACRAKTVIMLAGTNNSSASVSPASTIADYVFLLNALTAAGKRVILLAEAPRGTATVGGTPAAAGATAPASQARLSGTTLNYHGQLRRWIMDAASQIAGVWVIDAWPLIGDPASATGDFLPFATRDSLHLAPYGCYRVAQAILPLLQAWYPARNSFADTNASFLYHASENPRGNLLANPALTGTGGAKAAGDTGNVATGWTSRRANMTGWTSPAVAWSKVAVASGPLMGADVQQVDVSGTGDAANSPAISVTQDITLGNVAAGDVLEFGMWAELDASSSNVNSVQLFVAAFGDPGGSNYFARTLVPINKTSSYAVSGARYPIPSGLQGSSAMFHRVLSWTAPSGLTLLRFQAYMEFVEGVAVSAQARFGRCWARKVL